jgi:hypothetical protein
MVGISRVLSTLLIPMSNIQFIYSNIAIRVDEMGIIL